MTIKKKNKKKKCPNAEDALAKNIPVESEDVKKKKNLLHTFKKKKKKNVLLQMSKKS